MKRREFITLIGAAVREWTTSHQNFLTLYIERFGGQQELELVVPTPPPAPSDPPPPAQPRLL